MEHVVVVRPYEPRDRAAVRQICCDTADVGKPLGALFPDREVVADVVTRYYTDVESQATWVAVCQDRVIGYLTGCLDSRRYQQVMTWRVVPRALMKGVLRGALGFPHTWRLLGAATQTWRRGGFDRRIALEAYPAHLHINLQQDFRGQHVGRQLVERFIEQVKATGKRGIHVGVNGENVVACRFFEQLGFTLLSRHPVVPPTGDAARHHETVIYGKSL